jgi:hypothetical protein
MTKPPKLETVVLTEIRHLLNQGGLFRQAFVILRSREAFVNYLNGKCAIETDFLWKIQLEPMPFPALRWDRQERILCACSRGCAID